jgi:multiple sugar transport system ATP-binding protein
MNFMPVEVEGGTAKLPFAEVKLPDATRRALESSSSGKLMAGIRPEHFEDAELVGDQSGPTFEVKVEILESMGSELYAYFNIESGSGARSEQLDELAADTGAEVGGSDEGELQIVARLDADSGASEGESMKMWMDPERLHFFDVDSGDRIVAEGEGEGEGGSGGASDGRGDGDEGRAGATGG